MDMCKRTARPWLAPVVLALCALHAWMAASVSRTFSTTVDEVAHLTAGYAYWTRSDYRLQPENGILPQRLASLPLLAMDLRFPSADTGCWREANVWLCGYRFLFKQGNDTAAMLAAGRAMIALLSALLCLLVFTWTRELFGLRAGLLALSLAAFAPELLAHGGLATSDTAAALGFALAVLAWWRLLRLATPGRFLAAGLAAGLLACSKHSVVLFAPIALLMLALRMTRPAPLVLKAGGRRLAWRGLARIPVAGGLLAGSALVCLLVIWSLYGFRYSAAPHDAPPGLGFAQSWDQVLLREPPPTEPAPAAGDAPDRQPGVVQHFAGFARDKRLLPEAWLYGLAFVERHSRSRPAYFAGEYRDTGWRLFFPVAFATKTTLPSLLLFACGAAALALARPARRRAYLWRASPLLVLLGVYWTFSVLSNLNIGHRHLLPAYPALYALAGASALLLPRGRLWPAVIALLLCWHVAASLHARPGYLSYFNPIVGSKNAHRLFVDSSLDWGQDLPRLRRWLETNAGDRPFFLSYFGSGSPLHEGIEAVRFGDGYFDWEPRRTPPPLRGGLYCISATMFRRVYTQVRGPWSADYEKHYQDMMEWTRQAARRPAGQPPAGPDGGPLPPAAVQDRLFAYEQLQFGRLCHYLQFRAPAARVGDTFLVFELSDDEVAFALRAPLPALNRHLLNEASLR